MPLASLTAAAYPTPHWSPQVRLNPTASLGVSDLEVKVADDGSAMAVWIQLNGGIPDVVARHYDPVSGWGPETAIDSATVWVQECTMRIAGNRAGDVAVTWLEWNATDWIWTVMAAHYTGAWGWSPAVRVATNTTVYANCDQYAVAVNENGDATVAWMTTNGTVWHVRAARFYQGLGWRPEEIVTQMVNGTGLSISVAVDDAGTSTVMWSENNGDDEFVFASRAAAQGAWSAALKVFQHFDNGATVVWDDYLRVVAPLPGAVVAAWRIYNGSWYAVWETHYWAGSWSPAAIVSDNGAWADFPTLAYSQNGTTTLAMAQGSRIAVKWFTPGVGWSATSNVTGFIGYNENGVAVNAVGQTVLVWQQWNGSAFRLYASTWAPWSTWSTVNQVDFMAANASASWVSVGVDGEGNAIATWPSYNGTVNLPWASKLTNADPDPLPLTIDWPRNRESVGAPSITVRGQTTPGATVTVNGVAAAVAENGSYAATLTLQHGWTRVVVNATGRTGPLAARAAWVAYTDPTYARANETADAPTTGWTPVRSVAGAVDLQTIYTSYGGSIWPTYANSMGANGDGMAFWIASNGTVPFLLYAVPYVNGSGWQAPRLLSASNSAAFNVNTETDGAGRSTLVWEQNMGTGNTIWYARFDRMTGWAENQELTPAPDRGYFPRMAADASGQLFVTYARTNVSGTQYVAVRATSGAPWQAPIVLGLANGIADHALAAGGNSQAVAVWTTRAGSLSNVTAFRYNPANLSWGPGESALINSTYIYDMRAVINGSGGATVVYRQPTSGTSFYNLTAIQTNATGSWSAPIDIDGSLDRSTQSWRYGLGIDAQGNVMVMLVHVVSGVQRAVSLRYTPSGGWGAYEFIDPDLLSKSWVLGDVSDDGTAVAAWYENNGTTRVQAARYLPGQGWQAPEYLTPPGGYNYDVWVAMTTGGRATVIAMHYPNYGGYYSQMAAWRFTPPDLTPPPLAVSSPANNSTTGAGWAAVSGTTERGARVWVNGFEAVVDASGAFTVSVPLVNGTNLLRAVARDAANNTAYAWVNVTFADPVLQALANLSAADAALQLDLDNVNATLAQAIADLGATTVQQLADLNATLLARLAAQNASLAAEIGALNASLLVQLADLDASLRAALDAQNSSLWQAINDQAAATAAANQALGDALNSTADALRVEIAALEATQDMTDANVSAAVARLAALEARLTALSADLNLTHDELLALLDGLGADLNDTRADFNARLDGTDANATGERARVNAAMDALGQQLNATRASLAQADANLTVAVAALESADAALESADADLETADSANAQQAANANQLAQGAQGLATIVAALAAAGIAVGLVAAVLAMRARKPAFDAGPAPAPAAAPPEAPAEEVKLEPAHGGASQSASSEVKSAEGDEDA